MAPTQLPVGASHSPLADLVVRINPVGSALHYVAGILVDGHGWTQDASYLAAPLLAAVIACGALLAVGHRLVRLTEGASGG